MTKIYYFSQASQSPTNPQSYASPQKRDVKLFCSAGIFCVIVSLFVVPEIFGSVAIILGAYTWRLDYSEKSRRGLILMIFALVAMFVGIYYTSFLGLFQILP